MPLAVCLCARDMPMRDTRRCNPFVPLGACPTTTVSLTLYPLTLRGNPAALHSTVQVTILTCAGGWSSHRESASHDAEV
jgi:hypothetical protein